MRDEDPQNHKSNKGHFNFLQEVLRHSNNHICNFQHFKNISQLRNQNEVLRQNALHEIAACNKILTNAGILVVKRTNTLITLYYVDRNIGGSNLSSADYFNQRFEIINTKKGSRSKKWHILAEAMLSNKIVKSTLIVIKLNFNQLF